MAKHIWTSGHPANVIVRPPELGRVVGFVDSERSSTPGDSPSPIALSPLARTSWLPLSCWATTAIDVRNFLLDGIAASHSTWSRCFSNTIVAKVGNVKRGTGGGRRPQSRAWVRLRSRSEVVARVSHVAASSDEVLAGAGALRTRHEGQSRSRMHTNYICSRSRHEGRDMA